MATFRDKKNREWTLELDGPTVQEVRAETCGNVNCKHRPLSQQGCDGIDLADLTGKTFERLDQDMCLLVDVLWLLCRDQATAKGISDSDFGRSLGGDSISEAAKALVRACCDFLPPTKRQYLERTDAKRVRMAELALQRGIQKIEDPETEARLLKNLDDKLEQRLQDQLTPSNSV
jgi:hypothetical protein